MRDPRQLHPSSGPSVANPERWPPVSPDVALRPLSRRSALRSTGLAGLGLAIVACSTKDGSTGATRTTTAAPGTTTAAPGTTAGASDTSAAGADSAGVCVLTPEATEGPFYAAAPQVRPDIREDREGFPLELAITVIDPSGCAPVAGAAVDIWHCDAGGYYSGFSNNPGGGDVDLSAARFLRGVQFTDASGVARFTTVYPGWYQGRTVHIHIKVHTDVTDPGTGKALTGGHVAHTGQMFFDDGLSDRVFKLAPYVRSGSRTLNTQDGIFGAAGGTSAIATVTPKDPEDLTKGFVGTLTVGVDPDATPVSAGGRGGPGF